jgi:hypothetical protein
LQLIDPSADNERVANWVAVDPATSSSPLFTPGGFNSVVTNLARFPEIRLNEIQARNIAGVTNHLGERAPWLEIHSRETNDLDLAGLYLTDDPGNLARWRIPDGTVIRPGDFLLVWLDGKPGASIPGELHAGFQLGSNATSIALVGFVNNRPAVFDYLRWDSMVDDHSFGLYPDANIGGAREFYFATPGAANDPSPGPDTIFINEWMASNVTNLTDSVDQQFEDWIEIYNPNNVAVELTGFTLTDSPTNLVRWTFPAGTIISPHGYRLIWADNEPAQNNPTNADLHADFKLDKSGDVIALFGSTGRLVDAVEFGHQSDDVSAGRFPDGGAGFWLMTTPTPRLPNVVPSIPTPELRIIETGVSPGNYFIVSWQAIPGATYRVESTDNLAGSAWTPLPGDVFAWQDIASKADPGTIAVGPRYYRVVKP